MEEFEKIALNESVEAHYLCQIFIYVYNIYTYIKININTKY